MLLAKGCILSIKSGAEHHPCCSGLQVQGTAKSPAARKLYDIFGIADQTIFFSIALIFDFVNLLLLFPELFDKFTEHGAAFFL